MTDDTDTAVVIHEAAPVAVSDPSRQGAIFALGSMDEATFNAHSATLANGLNRLRRIQRDLLVRGTDHDTLGGETRTVLLKPGAEKLASFASLVATFSHTLTIDRFPDAIDRITYTFECLLHHGTAEGPVVGQGVGICTSWETKYRWRKTDRRCPDCKAEAILRAKDRPEWFCWRKRGGCGNTFQDGTPKAAAIAAQDVGRTEVDDPYEQINTIAKMAEKRSFVDAVIRALNASALFTQDVEASVEPVPVAPESLKHQAQLKAPPAIKTAPKEDPEDARAFRLSATSTPLPAHPGESFEGIVGADPDGVRNVKVPEWATVVKGEFTDKVELVFKVGARKHTAIVLGPLAKVVNEKVHKDDAVVVVGTLKEITWAEGKPTKKEIHDVTDVAVGGFWLKAETLPLADVDHGRPHEDGPDVDLTDEALMTFADLLDTPPAADPMLLPLRSEPKDTPFLEPVTVLLARPDKTQKGRAYAHIWLLPTNGRRERVEMVLDHEEAEANGVYALTPDQVVSAAGTWALFEGRSIVVGTTVAA